MSSEGQPAVFPTYIPGGRSVVVDDQHGSASIYILTLLSIVYSFSFLLARLSLRWGSFGTDDLLATTATATLVGEAAAVFLSLKNGIGTSFDILSAAQIESAAQTIFAVNILSLITFTLAKCSVIVLLMRLFNLMVARAHRSPKFMFYRNLCLAVAGLIGLWGIGSLIAVTLNYAAESFVDPTKVNNTCPSQDLRYAAIMAVDVVTELLLVFIAILNVWPLQMSRETKTQVVLAFSFRLPCAALSIVRFHYLKGYMHNNPNGMAIIPVLNITQVELCWSLVSATIPTLKGFVKSFNSGFGMGLDTTTAYPGSHGQSIRGYELSHIDADTARGQTPTASDPSVMVTKIGTMGTAGATVVGTANVWSDNSKQGSVSSVGSQEQIIRKDVRWDVNYE